MKQIAIIGSGISGLSAGQLLKDEHHVTLFEKAPEQGGLIKCKRVNGTLYHTVGGHLFNSHIQPVFDWFWSFFDKDTEFLQATRNAKILLNNQLIGYPIENFLYQLDETLVKQVVDDLINLKNTTEPENFEQFLIQNFGNTLYEMYFKPYNRKIWNTNLSEIPLAWLDGKLPMPDVQKIFFSNITRQGDKEMVHSSFYYPRENGSQFIVNRFSEGLEIRTNIEIISIEKRGNQFVLNESEVFDEVIFTGDIRELVEIWKQPNPILRNLLEKATALKSNATTNVLCEIEASDLSWLYLPDPQTAAHRIIYTGNFSPTNNASTNVLSAVIEFSGQLTFQQIQAEIQKLPFAIKPLDWNFQPASYVIQNSETRQLIEAIRHLAEPEGLYLLGRFAEWEYHNMDKCMESAMKIKLKMVNG